MLAAHLLKSLHLSVRMKLFENYCINFQEACCFRVVNVIDTS